MCPKVSPALLWHPLHKYMTLPLFQTSVILYMSNRIAQLVYSAHRNRISRALAPYLICGITWRLELFLCRHGGHLDWQLETWRKDKHPPYLICHTKPPKGDPFSLSKFSHQAVLNLWIVALLWATYQTPCISDVYIMVYSISKIAVMK